MCRLAASRFFWPLRSLGFLAVAVALFARSKSPSLPGDEATRMASNVTLCRFCNRMAQGLLTVTDQLEPKTASQVYGQAAAALTQAMRKQTSNWQSLAQSLMTVTARMEPKKASQVCGQAAAILTQAMRKPRSSRTVRSLGESVFTVTAHMEPKEAAPVGGSYTGAINFRSAGQERATISGTTAAAVAAPDAGRSAQAPVLRRRSSTSGAGSAQPALSPNVRRPMGACAVRHRQQPAPRPDNAVRPQLTIPSDHRDLAKSRIVSKTRGA